MKTMRTVTLALLVSILVLALVAVSYASSLFDAIEKGDADRFRSLYPRGQM